MCSALGGRAAEQLIFGKISTGALSDLEKVTKQAYAMVSIYGLNERVGNISFYDSQGRDAFTKPYSDDTARIIDEEVSKLIEAQYQRALQILSENKDKLTALADKLLDKEVIFKEDLEEIFGKRLWSSEEEINSAVNTPPNDDTTIDFNPENPASNDISDSDSNIINPTIEPLDNSNKTEE
ncbi:ATP-dependent zinc metalloprotease FtsH [compost metagenome]